MDTGVQTVTDGGVHIRAADTGSLETELAAARFGGLRRALSPRDRARIMAELHRRETGELPTIRELAEVAEVSRGTAANAVEELREPPQHLHMITTQPDDSTQP